MKKVLIPLVYDYYLFDYFTNLIKELKKRKYVVYVFTADKSIYYKYKNIGAEVRFLPLLIRLFLKRSGNIFFRSFLWISSYFWVVKIRRNYDFCIVPWDNKPLWNVILRNIPSLTVHSTTNLISIESELSEHRAIKSYRLQEFFERKTNLKILPRFNNVVLKHNKFWYLDKIFGMKSQNLIQGFSGVNHVTVTGKKIKSTLLDAGLDESKTKLHVVGNPSYDGFIEFAKNFDKTQYLNIKKKFNIPLNSNLYSLFLSPSCFSDTQIKEVSLVIDTIYRFDNSAAIFLKLHPKTNISFIRIFESLLLKKKLPFYITKKFYGDLFNLKIILSSKCILQKQGTVGYISMLVSKPIISYDFFKTNYHDDMFKILKSSFHCESPEEMITALNKLENKTGKKELDKLQDLACQNFCIRDNNCSKKIVDIIDNHLK